MTRILQLKHAEIDMYIKILVLGKKIKLKLMEKEIEIDKYIEINVLEIEKKIGIKIDIEKK